MGNKNIYVLCISGLEHSPSRLMGLHYRVGVERRDPSLGVISNSKGLGLVKWLVTKYPDIPDPRYLHCSTKSKNPCKLTGSHTGLQYIPVRTIGTCCWWRRGGSNP